MKDFDSTGQYYKQYVANWANYLDSAIKGYSQLPSTVSSKSCHRQFTAIRVSSSPAEHRTCERSTWYIAQAMETPQLRSDEDRKRSLPCSQSMWYICTYMAGPWTHEPSGCWAWASYIRDFGKSFNPFWPIQYCCFVACCWGTFYPQLSL